MNPQATARVLAILRRIELAESLHRATLTLYGKDLELGQIQDLRRLAERLDAVKNQVLTNLRNRLR